MESNKNSQCEINGMGYSSKKVLQEFIQANKGNIIFLDIKSEIIDRKVKG